MFSLLYQNNTNSRFFKNKGKLYRMAIWRIFVLGATQKRVNNILRPTGKGDAYYPRNRDNSVIQLQ